MRAVDSRDFYTAKLQSSKLNMSLLSLKSLKLQHRLVRWAGQGTINLHGENLLFVAVLRLGLIIAELEHVSPS